MPDLDLTRQRQVIDALFAALCLTLATNAAVLWTTTNIADALAALRAEGFPVSDARSRT